jgi:hypothetical protein
MAPKTAHDYLQPLHIGEILQYVMVVQSYLPTTPTHRGNTLAVSQCF